MLVIDKVQKGDYKGAAVEAAPIVGYGLLAVATGIFPAIAIAVLINAEDIIKKL